MNEKEVQKIVSEQNKALLTEFHKIAIGLRESVTPSFSHIIKDLTDKIEFLDKKSTENLAAIEKKLDYQIICTRPAIEAINASRILASILKWTAGVILSVGSIWLFFKLIVKEALK
ncbi:MAG: hypothetical protein WC803_12860 [Sphingomonas sp.]|jgi:hypothetical protein